MTAPSRPPARALKATALWLVVFHFLTVVLHSIAHGVLRVKAAGFSSKTRVVELNGLFAVAAERENVPHGFANKVATLFQINDEGLIERIYFVIASRKLTALPPVNDVNAVTS